MEENDMQTLNNADTNKTDETLQATVPMERVSANGHMSKIYPYAGFWKRAFAFIIDSIVIGVVCGVVAVPLMYVQIRKMLPLLTDNVSADPSNLPPDMFLGYMGSMFAMQVVAVLVLWLYNALMESSAKQATLGKMALGIKVVGADGERISFARATGRAFAKFLSNMTLYFGNYMAGYTSHRQSLHDIITSTYVVDKNLNPGEELPGDKWSTAGLITSIIVAIAPVVLYLIAIITFIAMGIANTPAA